MAEEGEEGIDLASDLRRATEEVQGREGDVDEEAGGEDLYGEYDQ